MSFITKIEEMGDMKIENEGNLGKAMRSVRRRSLPALTITQTDWWIQDTQLEGNTNFLSNPGVTKDVNEVPAVRTTKQTEKGLAYSLGILFDRQKRLLLRLQKKVWKYKKSMFRAVSEELKQYDDLLKLRGSGWISWEAWWWVAQSW